MGDNAPFTRWVPGISTFMKRRATPPVGHAMGFTLIEILIVVVILGLLASIVIAQFTGVTVDAARTAFANNGRIFTEAAKRYELDYGIYPNAAPGELPPGFGDYITAHQWTGSTPVGGIWDSGVNAFGVAASLGVFFPSSDPNNDDAYMLEFDEMFDDGNLDTGMFRKMSETRYYFIVVE
jgi:prepilin-type N-terminal cleavage/methylation domain-containing protein